MAKGAQVRARQLLDLGRLPDALVLGVQRGGSTSLHSYLSQHPQITSAISQEVHYFDVQFANGIGWYRAQFRNRRSAPIAFDNSPYYIFHPAVPKRVSEALSSAVKFIVMLRNPVDRAVSQYWLSVSQGYETLPLEEAIERETERLGNSEELLRTGAIEKHFAHRNQAYLSRGLYARQLRNWFEHHDRSRFLVLRSEDLFADPAATMKKVYAFLGAPDFPGLRAKPLNKGSKEQMEPALRARMEDYFAAPNRELESLLGQKFDWR